MKGKRRVFGSLRTPSLCLFLYLEKSYSQRETARWTCYLWHLMEEADLASAQFSCCQQTDWPLSSLHVSLSGCQMTHVTYLHQRKIIGFSILIDSKKFRAEQVNILLAKMSYFQQFEKRQVYFMTSVYHFSVKSY